MFQEVRKRVFAAAGVLMLVLLSGAASFAETYNLIDFVVLKNGDLEGRADYEVEVRKIAARYGAETIHSHQLNTHLAGPMNEAVQVNVWAMNTPDTLEKVVTDPDYKALIPRRNEIHDMSKLTLYLGQPIMSTGPITEGAVLVDLVSMKGDAGNAERDAYEKKIAPLAEKYGFKIAASYKIIEKFGGAGPARPLRLNLWQGTDPAAIGKLAQDPAYLALEDERNRITDFDNLVLFLADPQS